MAAAIDTIGVEVDTHGVVKGTKDLDNFGKAAGSSSKAADVLSSSVKGLVGAYVSLQGIQALAGAIDKHTKYTAQLKLATRSQEEFNIALKDVSRIANTAQADIGSMATLYARLNNAVRELNVSQAEVARITETVGLGLKISGATAQESASAMLQLSQAFGSGVLRGEEFNAVNEAAPALMRALAESIGIPVGQLRKMAEQGELTSDVLVNAFGDEKLLKIYREQAKEMGTIDGAITNVKNATLALVGAFDTAYGARSKVSAFFEAIAQGINKVSASIESGSFQKLFDLLGRYSNPLLALTGAGRDIAGKIGAPAGISQSASGTVKYVEKAGGTTTANVDIKYIDKLKQEAEAARRVQIESANKIAEEKSAIEKKFNDMNDENIRVQAEAQFQREIDYLEKTEQEKIKAEKDEYDRKVKMLDALQKEANKNYEESQRAANKAIEEQQKAWDRMTENIARSLTDSIMRGFENGKSFIQNFKDAITNAFKSYVLNIGVSFVQGGLNKVFGSIFGGSQQSSSSTGSIFGDIKSAIDGMNGDLVGSIEKLGAFLSNGQGGLGDKIGGFLGANAGTISKGLPYLSSLTSLLSGDFKGAAFGAAGTFLGNLTPLGPIGGAIGGAIGKAIGGLFGGKDIPMVGSQAKGTYSGGTFSVKTSKFGDKDIGAQGALGQLAESFSKSLGGLFKSFGIDDTISTTARYRQRTNARGYFSATFAGGRLGFDQIVKNQSFEKYAEKVLGKRIVQAIEKSLLSADIKSLFTGLTKSETVQNMISALNKLSLSSDQLDDRFGLTLDQSAAVSKATGLTGDALAQYISQLGDLAYGYNTSEAVLEKAKKRLEETYGGSLPKDIDAFDAKIKAIDKTTQGGIELTAKLLGMRSDFIAYNDAIKQFNSTLVDSATILGLIEQNSNLYSDAASFNTAKALAGQGVNAIYNSSDASQNGRIMIDELVKLRTSIASLIEEAKKTNDNTLTTARTLLQVTDGVTLLTSTA